MAWISCTWSVNAPPLRSARKKGESKARQKGRLSFRVRYCAPPFKKGEPGEPSSALDAVRELAARRGTAAVDAIVVKPHWRPEYYPGAVKTWRASRALAANRRLARRWLDAGATAVLGQHAHHVAPAEWHRAKDGRRGFVSYSVGSFTPQTFVTEASMARFKGWAKEKQVRCGPDPAKCRSGALLFLRLERQQEEGAAARWTTPAQVASVSFVPTCEVSTKGATFKDRLPRYVKDAANAIEKLPAYSGVVTVPAVGGACPESAAFVAKALGLGESGPPLDVERYVREEVCRGERAPGACRTPDRTK